MRGERPLRGASRLRFRCRTLGTDELWVSVVHRGAGREVSFHLEALAGNSWGSRTLDLGDLLQAADEIRFFLPPGGDLLLDDVLLYEP